MKQLFTSFFSVCITISTFAQIIIDSTDFGVTGDQIFYASDSSSSVTVSPPTGMAQTFNYTQLNPGFSGTVEFLDPAITTEAALFPEATAAISVFSEDIFYVQKLDTALNMVGLYSDLLQGGSSVPLKFYPAVTMAKFPMSFNDAYNLNAIVDTIIQDTFSGLFDSIRIKRNVNITSHVDAYGTLNLPNLTTDVLRQYEVETFSDTAWGLLFGQWQNITQQYSENYYYRFLGKNKKYYLLELQTDLSNNVIGVNYQPGNSVIAQIPQYNDVFCFGSNDGLALASAIGGTPPYTYSWSHGAIDSVASSLYAGNYTVTVTDATGDTSSISVFIDQPDSLEISVDSIGADYGNQEGYIHIAVQGGVPIYLYNWSNGENNQNNSNLSFGNYTVTVTDNNQCSSSKTFNVPNLTSVEELMDSGFMLYPNPTNGKVNVEAHSSWQLKVFSTSGALVAELKGAGNTSLDLTHLRNGMYFLNVKTNGVNASMQLQVVH